MHIPLKVTTDYSILQSLIKIDDLISFLIKNKIPACAICDDNLSGVAKFYLKCLQNKIKPLIGLNIKIDQYDIYLYALNYKGYKNLLKINTQNQKVKINFAILDEFKDDLAVIIPYESHSLYDSLAFFKYVYIGYKNANEKTNAHLISDNIIFVNNLKALFIEDLKYLEILDKLRKEPSSDYSYNYYFSNNVIDEDKIKEFVALFSLRMPVNKRYIPTYNLKVDSFKYLVTLAKLGLQKRLNDKVSNKYQVRLNYELKIIKEMGFVDYFLIVYDYVLYAKKNHILVGPGRGSAAGSLVSYAIGITDIDPLKYNLLFERFLNPARITMPDIDIDFDATKREQVINYVQKKYGNTKVAAGLTYNTLKSKLVLREIAKINKVNDNLLEKFIKEIDARENLKNNLKNKNVQTYLNNYRELKDVYQTSLKLEGLKKNISTHAAGIVISNVNLDEVIPIMIHDGNYLTGFTMDYLEDIGLLKMDFLGLKNLTTIANILNNIGVDKLNNISLEEKEVYKLFQNGKTAGIFQFETSLLKNLCLRLKPTCFNDLVSLIALGRPGPKEHVESFIKRRNGLEEISYLHPDLEPILKETYGIILYQEQIITILVKIGGYTYQEADLIRRAISKKKIEVMLKEAQAFVKRAVKKGYYKELAENIFKQITDFASYGFNKSHSVAYSLIAYQMAYLKTFYPVYFVIELLNTNNPKNNLYLNYLKQKNVKFVKPSVNNLKGGFYYQDNNLYLPLTMIKGISKDIETKIFDHQDKQYSNYFDFVIKTHNFLNKDLIYTLIYAGALDCFNLNKHTLINNFDSILNYALLNIENNSLIDKPLINEEKEYDDDFLREKEYASFGMYLTNHPASKYNYFKIVTLNNYLFKYIKIVVLIENIKSIKTKNGEDMAFLSGSDETGIMDFTVFPNKYLLLKNITKNDLVLIEGKVTKRFANIQVEVTKISKL